MPSSEQLEDLDTVILVIFIIFAIGCALFLTIGGILVLVTEKGSWILLGLFLLAVAGFTIKFIWPYSKELGRRFE